MKKKFWIVGGDNRIATATRLLAEEGHEVHAFALKHDIPNVIFEEDLQGINTADYVILPLPVQNDRGFLATPSVPDKDYPMAEILDQIDPNGPVMFGGFVVPALADLLEERGLKVHDYFSRPDMAVATAIPTSEGVLMYAMQETPFTINDANVLIIGYGNVGRCCADRFNALGAHVTVATFELPQYAWANATPGLTAIQAEKLPGTLGDYDIIVNAAPTQSLGRAELEELKSTCLILNPASKPCVDPELAKEVGIRYLRIGHIPGKVAPLTAGTSVKKVICTMIEELEA